MHQSFLKIIFFSLLLIASLSISAIELRFTAFNVDDGLPHETIRDMLQDDKGFMWFATDAGLVRFDGFDFKKYPIQLDAKTSNNVLSEISLDKEGNIWLATLGTGVVKFNPTSESFESVGTNQLSSLFINTLFIDENGDIWVGTTENGLNKITPHETGFEIVNFEALGKSVSNPFVTAINEDNFGRIWVGTNGGGVDVFNPATNQWSNYRKVDDNQGNSISGNQIRSLLKDSNGNIWIGTAASGLNLYDVRKQTVTQYHFETGSATSLANERVLSLFQDSNGSIWIGTDDGISIYSDGQFSTIKAAEEIPYSLSNNRVMSIYEDAGGIIWVGTYSGLNKWHPATAVFNHTLPRISADYSHKIVTDFAERRPETLFVATYGGGIIRQNNSNGSTDLLTKESGLPDNRIMSLMVDRDNGLWVGTRASGLVFQPAGSDSWTIYDSQSNGEKSLPSNGVTDILQDREGNIWVSTYAGGISKKTKSGFINIGEQDSDGVALSSKNVLKILEDSDGWIWAATDKGINRVDPKDYSVRQFTQSSANQTGFSTTLLLDLYEDSKGNLWLASQGSGIGVWKYQDRLREELVITQIDESKGLPSNTIYGIQEDTSQNIWLSSARGISRINSVDLEVENYNTSHGLQGYDFNQGAVFKDSDGRIYFGGTNGYNHFLATDIFFPTPPPKVELLGINVIDKPAQQPNQLDKLVLEHDDYLVSFDYVALDFAAPEKNQYQYQLANFDANWIDVQNRRRATYTNLPPGSYEFKVRAANNDGVWSEPQVNLAIRVHPAPWQTPLAYSFYVSLLGLTIFLLLRNQVRKLAQEEKQRKELESQVAKRTKELALQNNELQKLNEELEQAHRIDSLTGIFNRHFLDHYLVGSLAKMKRLSQQPEDASAMPIMLIDIDNLKLINDQLGHAAGDATISYFATLINKLLPTDHHLIRWGGDEFMLLGIAENQEKSFELLKTIINEIRSEKFSYFNNPISLSCSIGLSFYPFDRANPDSMSWDQVTTISDKALFQAKKQQGISWCAVPKPKRDINDIYRSEIVHCTSINEVADIVEIKTS